MGQSFVNNCGRASSGKDGGTRIDDIDVRLKRMDRRLREIRAWEVKESLVVDDWIRDDDNTSIRTGSLWSRGRQCIVLKKSGIVVPDDWHLADTRLRFDTHGTGNVILDTSDKRTVLQLDEVHTDYAVPARVFKACLTLWPMSSHGAVHASVRWRAALTLAHHDVSQLVSVIGVLLSAAKSALDGETAETILRYIEDSLAVVKLPSGTGIYLSAIAREQALSSLWDGSELVPPLSPLSLTVEQQSSFRQAGDILSQRLEEMRVWGWHETGQIFFLGHIHLDYAWLWPAEVTKVLSLGIVGSELDRLERNHDYICGQSSAALYAAIADRDPELFAAIKRRVAEGRWELLGGMWSDTDANLPAGESLVRNLLMGQRYYSQSFGRMCEVGWLVDTFGFGPCLPQLLTQAGISSFVCTKLRYADTNPFPYGLFWWVGLDGSRVLTSAGQGADGYSGRVSPESISRQWQAYTERSMAPALLQPMSSGTALGPTDEDFEAMPVVSKLAFLPRLEFTLASKYFERADLARSLLPSWKGELYLEAHRGTYTSQGRTKRLNRQAENELVTAEVVETIAAMMSGQMEFADLEKEWKTLLDNQSHDVVAGTAINAVHRSAETELGQVCAVASEITKRSLKRLTAECSGGRPGMLVVNPSGSGRPVRVVSEIAVNGAQRTQQGFVVASADVVPGLGGRLLCNASSAGVSVIADGLENRYVQVRFDDNGRIRSLRHLESGTEFVGGVVNDLRVYSDRPPNWDAWELYSRYEYEAQEAPLCEEMEVVERGPHRGAWRMRYRFRDSEIMQEVRLWANSARIDLFTTIDWHERKCVLRSESDLSREILDSVSECAFGIVRRAVGRNTSWQRAMYEFPAIASLA